MTEITIFQILLGLVDEDIQSMEADFGTALLEEHETALLVFVIKAMKSSGSIIANDMANLRRLGWEDKGTSGYSAAMLISAFGA